MRIRSATLVACCLSCLVAQEIHVDNAATEPGDGSAARPYASIQAAAAVAVAGDVVRIHAGTYRETVVPANDGEEGRPIVFTAAGDGPVVIDGADPLTGWTRVAGSDSLWQAEYPEPFLSSLHQHEQLFCDGAMLWTARTPNRPTGRGFFHPDRYLQISSVVGIESVGQGTATPWGPVAKGGARRITFTCDVLDDPADAWPAGSTLGLQPQENQSWGFWAIGPVEAYADGRITAIIFSNISTDQHAFSRVTSGTDFFLARGSGAELDAPGEWYHDRDAGAVRVWLPEGGDPNQRRMTIKRRDYAFDLSGRAWIEVRDLAVQAATITTDNQLGDGVGMGAWLTHNRGSVDSPSVQGNAAAHHITLEDLRLRHVNHFLGTWGNPHGQWTQSSGLMIAGTHHVVRDCRIGATAGNGMVLFGTDHRVSGNFIHDVGYSGAHVSGIYIAQTPGNTPGTPVLPDRIEIDRNTLVAGGWGLIDGSSLYTTDPDEPSRIHHNYIDGAGLLTRDVGGIRFVGHTVDNPVRTGPTRIDHNIVRNVVAALGNPIYFDFCDDYQVDHNLIYDCSGGININDGNNLSVTNNTMFGFQSGVGAVLGRNFNLQDSLVRNNIASRGFVTPGDKTGPGYVADHNLADADRSLFIDPANGDFRLRADATAAIDAGSTNVPQLGSTSGAPDLGAFERGHDDWIGAVGRPDAIHERPTDLVARARSDGTVHLTWTDHTGGRARYFIDRGYKTDHPNNGWEFLTVGSVPAGNTTAFVDQVASGLDTRYYRVRAEYSTFSPWAITAAGSIPSDTITFETEQGYADGPLFGQGSWDADPYTATDRDSTLVDDGIAVVPAQETLIVYGDYSLIDPTFDDTASRVGFSFRLRLRQVTAGDGGTALTLRVGGYGIWKKSTHAFELGLRRDGYLFANTTDGWKGIGAITDFAASATDWITVAGILDYDQRKVTDLTVNGEERTSGWAFRDTHADLHDGLWQINGKVADADAAVELDDLRLRISDAPVVWLSTLDDQLQEGDDDGLLRIACGHPPAADLPIRLTLAASATAGLDDVLLLDAADQPVELDGLYIPAGSNRVDLRIRAIADGVEESTETLVWELGPDAAYRRDADPVKRQALMTISGADADGFERTVRLVVQPLAKPIQIRALRSGALRDHDGSSSAVFAGLETAFDQTFEFIIDPLGDG